MAVRREASQAPDTLSAYENEPVGLNVLANLLHAPALGVSNRTKVFMSELGEVVVETELNERFDTAMLWIYSNLVGHVRLL